MTLTIRPNDPMLVRNALGLLGVADGAFKNREDIEKVVIEEGVGFVGLESKIWSDLKFGL